MDEVDKWRLMMRIGVSGWMFLLVLAHPGSPGSTAVKQLCVCVCMFRCVENVRSSERKSLNKLREAFILLHVRYMDHFTQHQTSTSDDGRNTVNGSV